MKHRRVTTPFVGLAAVIALAAGPLVATSASAAPAASPSDTITTLEEVKELAATLQSVAGERIARAEAAQADTAATAAPATGRIFGTNRYETAIKISQDSHPNPDEDFGGVVFLANGMNFPDALAAGPAATAQYGPILLVPPTGGLPANVKAEIQRLDPFTVIILGQTDNVSLQVEQELETIVTPHPETTPVVRFGGNNRYQTSAMVSQLVYFTEFDEAGNFIGYFPPETAYIANGATYADALAGGAAGGWETAPLLLTSTRSLDATVADFLVSEPADANSPAYEITTVRILGSVEAVSTNVENQIKAILPNATIKRYPGRDRFDTARLLNADVFGTNVGAEVTMTNGLNFPDALAGAPRVNATGGPTVLVRPACVPAPSAATLTALQPTRITALGNIDQVSGAALAGTRCP